MRLDFIDTLFETALDSKNPRIPHPEDSIFTGSAEAERAVADLANVIADPSLITIKWDGGIALYFGHTPNGEFFVSDKYMYPKGIYATSPEQWLQYDQTKTRGAVRDDLPAKLQLIWPGLQAAVGNTPGVFMGDLMHTGQLKPANGNFVFEPTTVTYTVPVNSPMGRLIAGKDGIVVVHKYNDRPWDGVSGLTNSGNVAIISPTAGNQFVLNEPTQLLNTAKKAIAQYGEAADEFRAGLGTKVAVDTIKTYFNKKITGQISESLEDYLVGYPAQHRKLIGEDQTGYIPQNTPGYRALETIWMAIYNLKVNLVQQLNAQVKGFTQTVDGKPGGEGFVFPGSVGLVKLVIRDSTGFGGTHFNKPRNNT